MELRQRLANIMNIFPQVELLIQEIGARPDIWIASRLCDQVLQTLRKT